jgi:hypothetical protein
MGKKYAVPGFREKLLQYTMWILGAFDVLFVVAMVMNTKDKTFTIESLIPLAWNKGLVSEVVIIFLEGVLKANTLLVVVFLMVAAFLYFYSIKFWLVKTWYEYFLYFIVNHTTTDYLLTNTSSIPH